MIIASQEWLTPGTLLLPTPLWFFIPTLYLNWFIPILPEALLLNSAYTLPWEGWKSGSEAPPWSSAHPSSPSQAQGARTVSAEAHN